MGGLPICFVYCLYCVYLLASILPTRKFKHLLGCSQDAELPFLTGFEVLPDEINATALKACNDASSETMKSVNDVRSRVNIASPTCG